MRLRHEVPRFAAASLAVLALGVTACSSSKSSSSSSSSSSSNTSSAPPASSATIASKLTLGGPAECQQNSFCIPGLQKVYGITFKSFKALDAAGPLTYQALTSGQIDIGEVFSTDALAAADNLVVLEDDKHLQSADAVVPVVRTDKASDGVKSVSNKVSAALTTDILKGLNKSVVVDKQDPQKVADNWLSSMHLNTPSASAQGVSLKIGGFNFQESSLLSYIYGDALKAAGAKVTVQANLGSRQTLEPGVQSGQVDMLIEYAASALEFVDNKAGLANGDVDNNVSHLSSLLQPKGVTVLTPSSAIDTNAFAVTKATAQKYSLSKMSDLANPAP